MRLGELEAEVMDLLWRRGEPVLVRDVMVELNTSRLQPLAYTTVQTVLDNLHRKRAVTRSRAGRAFLYRSAGTREQYSAALIAEAISGSDDRLGALLHYFGELSESERARLRQALEPAEGSAAAPATSLFQVSMSASGCQSTATLLSRWGC